MTLDAMPLTTMCCDKTAMYGGHEAGAFLKIFFFLMWTIFLKVFIEFVTILLLFLCFGFLAAKHVGS